MTNSTDFQQQVEKNFPWNFSVNLIDITFITLLALVFILLGASISGDQVSKLNIILEFCAPEDRPTYIGLTNTLLTPVTTLAPIIGGWLATAAGYQGMFVVAMFVAAVGGLLLVFWVREPRHHQPQATPAS
jgi:MFS family permease